MAAMRIQLDGGDPHVQVTPDGDEMVTVQLGDGPDGVTLVGPRYDIHRLILEADKQLARLAFPLY